MTDYIVSGCEFAPMNGTYVEYDTTLWFLYDGENVHFVMNCYGAGDGDPAYGRIYDLINSEANVDFEFPDWYAETVAPDDTGILFYLTKYSEPTFDGYSDMVITAAGGGDPSSIINHVMHYRRLMSR